MAEVTITEPVEVAVRSSVQVKRFSTASGGQTMPSPLQKLQLDQPHCKLLWQPLDPSLGLRIGTGFRRVAGALKTLKTKLATSLLHQYDDLPLTLRVRSAE